MPRRRRSNTPLSLALLTALGTICYEVMALRAAQRQRASARALEAASRLSSDGTVWNFAFGANIDPWKLQNKRQIRPVEQICGVVSGWRLCFNHRGGFGNICPVESTPALSALSPNVPHPAEVHGMLLRMTNADFAKLGGMEDQYDARPLDVQAYDGRTIKSLAFITQPRFITSKTDLLPTDRYINLLRRGSHKMGIRPDYCAFLDQIPCVPQNDRGEDYYTTGTDDRPPERGSKIKPQNARRRNRRRHETPPEGRKSKPNARNKLGANAAGKNDDENTILSEGGPCAVFARDDWLYVSQSRANAVVRRRMSRGNDERGGPGAGAGDDVPFAVCAGGKATAARDRAEHRLDRPWRLHVDDRHNIFVCDRNDARVVMWAAHDEMAGGSNEAAYVRPRTVAGGNGAGSGLEQLDQPVGVSVHPRTGDVYVSDRANHRVVRWPRQSPCEGVQGGSNDQDGDRGGDRSWVVDRSTDTGVVVAGGNGFGSRIDQLACPADIHVTADGTVYIADEANDRVVRWRQGETKGEVVVGNDSAGGNARLYHPLGLFVDADESFLLVTDSLHYRVCKYSLAEQMQERRRDLDTVSTPKQGKLTEKEVRPDKSSSTIAGSDGPRRWFASGLDERKQMQLGQPSSVALDHATGNLFVVDSEFGRLQQYSPEEQRARAAACAAADASSGASQRSCDGSSGARTAEEAKARRSIGRCVQYRGRGGFGFVVDEDGRKYFAHHSDIVASRVEHGYPGLAKGDRVEFEGRVDAKWGWRAARMTLPGGGPFLGGGSRGATSRR